MKQSTFRTRLLVLVLACAGVAVAAIAGELGFSETQKASLDLMQATILGLVEGLTEYLPVSSTGHLLLTQQLLGVGGSKVAANAYAICIQAGAILAVLGLYRERIGHMCLGIVGRHADGKRLVLNTLAAFIPAAILGFLGEKFIKAHLFGIWPITAAWLVGGVGILLLDRHRQGQDPQAGIGLAELTPRKAFFIGCLQCLAMWPGVSRSLATIVGGMFAGLSVAAAVEFSFILGLVTLGAATLYDGLKDGSTIIDHYGYVTPLIGMAVAWLSAVISVKWMVGYLNRKGLAIFGYYRIALAVVVGGMLVLGMVK
jgi:undecaprenyl-diphosphatase